MALIALVVIGGSTRVMEAGLACPDWPLCYGSFLPGGKMNIQVFLEWFHRLDAFFVGIALLIQFCFGIVYRRQLPKWIPWSFAITLILMIVQGLLGALTVIQLVPSNVVTSHLTLALILLSIMSGMTQNLLSPNTIKSPLWWRVLSGASLIGVISQSVIGARMATSWGSQLCISQGKFCHYLDLHRFIAFPVSALVLLFVFISFIAGGWPRSQWPFLTSLLFLLAFQITLGIISVNSYLSEPLIRISHQFIAALLVALLSGLFARRPLLMSYAPMNYQDSNLEVCHG